MDDTTKRDIWALFFMAVVAICIILVIGYVLQPTTYTFNINLNNESLEAFKIANNCTVG